MNEFIPAHHRLTMVIEGELCLADLATLRPASGRGQYDAVPTLKKITTRHHYTAQLLAEAFTAVEVAAIVDSTPQRIYQLLRDPAFNDLIAYYKDQRMVTHMEAGVRMRTKLEEIALESATEIADRISDPIKRAAMPISELRQLMAVAGDRSLSPPKVAQQMATPPTHITLNFGRTLDPKDEPKDVTPAPPAAPKLTHQPDDE